MTKEHLIQLLKKHSNGKKTDPLRKGVADEIAHACYRYMLNGPDLTVVNPLTVGRVQDLLVELGAGTPRTDEK